MRINATQKTTNNTSLISKSAIVIAVTCFALFLAICGCASSQANNSASKDVDDAQGETATTTINQNDASTAPSADTPGQDDSQTNNQPANNDESASYVAPQVSSFQQGLWQIHYATSASTSGTNEYLFVWDNGVAAVVAAGGDGVSTNEVLQKLKDSGYDTTNYQGYNQQNPSGIQTTPDDWLTWLINGDTATVSLGTTDTYAFDIHTLRGTWTENGSTENISLQYIANLPY